MVLMGIYTVMANNLNVYNTIMNLGKNIYQKKISKRFK